MILTGSSTIGFNSTLSSAGRLRCSPAHPSHRPRCLRGRSRAVRRRPTPRILRTKNVNDVDPNWAPPAFIGTSWSLIETRQEGEFLSGVLVSPRGGALPGRVFVIANEWDCG